MKKCKYKRFLSLILTFVLLFGLIPSVYASQEATTDGIYNSPEYAQQIEDSNKRIEDYIQNKIATYSGSRVNLNVPLYQQATTDTCSIASMQMVIDFKSTYYSQSTLLSHQKSNYGNEWNYVYAVTLGLNDYGLSYEYANTSNTNFTSGIVYSLDNSNPVICPVQTGYLPNYTDGTNTGHYVVLTGYWAAFSGNSYVNDIYYNDPHYNAKYYGSYTCEFTEMNNAVDAHSGYYIRGT